MEAPMCTVCGDTSYAGIVLTGEKGRSVQLPLSLSEKLPCNPLAILPYICNFVKHFLFIYIIYEAAGKIFFEKNGICS